MFVCQHVHRCAHNHHAYVCLCICISNTRVCVCVYDQRCSFCLHVLYVPMCVSSSTCICVCVCVCVCVRWYMALSVKETLSACHLLSLRYLPYCRGVNVVYLKMKGA